MRDNSCKLDGTVTVMTDFNVRVKGRMLCVHEDDLKARENARGASAMQSGLRVPSGIGIGGGGLGSRLTASHGRSINAKASAPPVFPAPEDASGGEVGEDGSMVDQRRSYRFFHVALYPRSAPSSLHTTKKGGKSDEEDYEPVFTEKDGGYTVIFSPIEVSDKTFADLIHKLHEEERVVQTIVLPTRHSWRHVQLWADAFPDAKILTSAAFPIEETSRPSVSEDMHSSEGEKGGGGGCRDFGDGVTGIECPEVDEAELNASTNDPPSADPQPFDTSVPFAEGLGHREDEDRLLDWILLHPGELYLKEFIGLRGEDRPRVELLVPPSSSSSSTPAPHGQSPLPYIAFTPSLRLYFIEGDPATQEYVLYDQHTHTLACSDLFHGEYSDLDPVNSWMCRVWFKFMKGGNHKRIDRVPREKWLSLRHTKGASLAGVRASIDHITRELPIRYLLFSHGTPPLVQDPANALRAQWGLPPLAKSDRPVCEDQARSP